KQGDCQTFWTPCPPSIYRSARRRLRFWRSGSRDGASPERPRPSAPWRRDAVRPDGRYSTREREWPLLGASGTLGRRRWIVPARPSLAPTELSSASAGRVGSRNRRRREAGQGVGDHFQSSREPVPRTHGGIGYRRHASPKPLLASPRVAQVFRYASLARR